MDGVFREYQRSKEVESRKVDTNSSEWRTAVKDKTSVLRQIPELHETVRLRTNNGYEDVIVLTEAAAKQTMFPELIRTAGNMKYNSMSYEEFKRYLCDYSIIDESSYISLRKMVYKGELSREDTNEVLRLFDKATVFSRLFERGTLNIDDTIKMGINTLEEVSKPTIRDMIRKYPKLVIIKESLETVIWKHFFSIVEYIKERLEETTEEKQKKEMIDKMANIAEASTWLASNHEARVFQEKIWMHVYSNEITAKRFTERERVGKFIDIINRNNYRGNTQDEIALIGEAKKKLGDILNACYIELQSKEINPENKEKLLAIFRSCKKYVLTDNSSSILNEDVIKFLKQLKEEVKVVTRDDEEYVLKEEESVKWERHDIRPMYTKIICGEEKKFKCGMVEQPPSWRVQIGSEEYLRTKKFGDVKTGKLDKTYMPRHGETCVVGFNSVIRLTRKPKEEQFRFDYSLELKNEQTTGLRGYTKSKIEGDDPPPVIRNIITVGVSSCTVLIIMKKNEVVFAHVDASHLEVLYDIIKEENYGEDTKIFASRTSGEEAMIVQEIINQIRPQEVCIVDRGKPLDETNGLGHDMIGISVVKEENKIIMNISGDITKGRKRVIGTGESTSPLKEFDEKFEFRQKKRKSSPAKKETEKVPKKGKKTTTWSLDTSE